MSRISNKLYIFGGFRFDRAQGQLFRNEDSVRLSPKATELLALLVERSGEFVSKEEIFRIVWADTFVEDGVLTQNIYTLRKALGTDENGRSMIENRTRLGYRLTVRADIQELESAELTPVDTSSVQTYFRPLFAYRSSIRLVTAAAVLILCAVSIWFGYSLLGRRNTQYFRKPNETVRFSRLTNSGDIISATMSADGNILAFTRGDKIFLQDIVANKAVELNIDAATSFGSLQFSTDSNYLYFRNSNTSHNFAKIMRSSRFGGNVTVIADRSYAAFGLSPNNRYLAYYAVNLPEVNLRLMVKDLEANTEREIFRSETSTSVCETCRPAWSPDGKRLIHVNQMPGNQPSQLYSIDVETGNREEIKLPRFRRFEQVAWFPEGNALIISATENGKTFQLWKVDYPKGEPQPLTNGLNSYKGTVISSDGRRILAVQSTENSNVFVSNPVEPTRSVPLTTGNANNYGQSSLVWIDNDSIAFSSQTQDEPVENLWSIDLDRRHKFQLTKEAAFSANSPFSDGKYIYYSVNRNKVTNISRVAADGSDHTEITNGTDGSRRSPQISPDGVWLYYIWRGQAGSKIMRQNLAAKNEEVFFDNEKVQCGLYLTISPNGEYLACTNWRTRPPEESEKYPSEIAVIPVMNTNDVRLYPIANIPPTFHFSADSTGIAFISMANEGRDLSLQPLSAGSPKVFYSVSDEKIFNFAWSPDGKSLAISQGKQDNDAVLLTSVE